MRKLACAALLLLAISAQGERRYPASGMVLKFDSAAKTVELSLDDIPGYMKPMVMPVAVRDAKELAALTPGALVDFELVVTDRDSYAEHVHVRAYQGLEADPLSARRLKGLERATSQHAASEVPLGTRVPDFALIDQAGNRVELTSLTGKVVALNFIYTRCALPNFCLRSSNNLAALQKRFRSRLGRDLILLTVTFDPAHDKPEVMAKYASTWNADAKTWHFLTGNEADIRRVCDLFGEDFFPEEGLMNHSLHTAVIGRDGKLVANLEGNQFTASQLGDLVDTVLTGRQ